MKLLLCNKCVDIFNLTDEEKTCKCGITKGRYINMIDAVYSGNCTPLGIDNSSFHKALLNRPKDGIGVAFNAFVIPEECKTFKKEK